MENLTIAATRYTPEVTLKTGGSIAINGKSYPENTFEFYQPVMEWLRAYFDGNAAAKTRVEMEIVYFNSSSSKLFFDLFDLLEEARQNGHDITVKWIYDKENESAQEAGEDFREDFESLQISLVEK